MKWTWTGSAFSTNESAWSAMVTGSQSRVWSGPEASDGTHWARVSNLHVKLRTYLLAIVASIIHLLDCPSAVGNASPCMMIADLTVPMCNRGPPPPSLFLFYNVNTGEGVFCCLTVSKVWANLLWNRMENLGPPCMDVVMDISRACLLIPNCIHRSSDLCSLLSVVE